MFYKVIRDTIGVIIVNMLTVTIHLNVLRGLSC